MASKDDVRTRAPRGTKNVTQAFFEALDGIPGSQQASVATAALASIRDEIKARRLKAREAAARTKAKAPAKKMPTGRAAKAQAAAATKRAPAAKKAAAKRMGPTKAGKPKPARRVMSPPLPDTATE